MSILTDTNTVKLNDERLSGSSGGHLLSQSYGSIRLIVLLPSNLNATQLTARECFWGYRVVSSHRYWSLDTSGTLDLSDISSNKITAALEAEYGWRRLHSPEPGPFP